MTPFYAYLSILYPDSIEQKFSIAKVSADMGFLVGPLIGSALYPLGGYPLPFYVIGTICLCCSPLLYGFLRQNKVVADEPTEEVVSSLLMAEDEKPIGYMKLFTHYTSVMLVMQEFAVNFTFTFILPVAVHPHHPYIRLITSSTATKSTRATWATSF
jgi:MFS family permease